MLRTLKEWKLKNDGIWMGNEFEIIKDWEEAIAEKENEIAELKQAIGELKIILDRVHKTKDELEKCLLAIVSEKDKEIERLKFELSETSPFADCYKRVCQTLGIEKDILGFIKQKDKEISILKLKNKSSLANNLCPDHRDKQEGKPCLACEIEQLKRIRSNLIAENNRLKNEMQKRDDYIEGCLV